MTKSLILLLFFSVYACGALSPFPFAIEYLEEEFSDKEEKGEAIEQAPTKVQEEITVKEFTPVKVEAIEQKTTGLFYAPKGLERNVDFWINIYVKYNSWEVVIHDSNYPQVVYEVVDFKEIFNKPINYRSQMRKINQVVNTRREYYKKLLLRIQNKNNRAQKDFSDEERLIFEKFSDIEEKDKFVNATRHKRMRMQFGLRDRFIEGIRKSGKYLDQIIEVFKENNLPIELTNLIYVESMFNLRAYSKVGASGIWQFMRGTGMKFLEINYGVDERRDPIISSRAAAKFLKENYDYLGQWPLAITAYNHGPKGMSRAVRLVGTTDLKEIIDNYKSRTFGFASKNFYACFLAALEVKTNFEKYFGPIERFEAVKYREFKMPDFVSISTLTNYLNLNIETIKELNPAIKEEVYAGHARVPLGYSLRVPVEVSENISYVYENIPQDLKHNAQKGRKYHRIQRGDSLWKISRQYNTTVDRLMRLNNLQGRNIIPGRLLLIP